MTGYEPFFGVPAYGDVPLYLAPFLLIEALWVIGMGIYFATRQRRERWGFARAAAGWGTLVVLTALSSHAAFRLMPPRLIYPAVALILLVSVTAPAVGTLVAGFFRKSDSAVLSVMTLSMLLILYLVGRAAGVSYETSHRSTCLSSLHRIHQALEAYREKNGDYPKASGWMGAVPRYINDGKMPVCRAVAVRPAGTAKKRTAITVQVYEYQYQAWREAEDDDIQVSCHHPATTFLREETLAITFGGKIVRK